MRRAAPGVAVVLSALVVAGCGNTAGAATTDGPEAAAIAAAPSAAPAPQRATNGLAGLIVVPAGSLAGDPADPSERSGPFSRESYLDTLSAAPAKDRALLLNAHFTEGYRTYRTSADRKKHITVQIFRVGSRAQADILQRGFWAQEPHDRPFAVPGVPDALADGRIVVSTAVGRSEAIAETSFVVGTLVTEITITQTGELTAGLTPDTALAATITKQQKQSQTRKAG
ncbi:hypothetical protein EV138_2180 [Kribbella voronezhensis]|uniref:Lipoprotein n=1 Tax=Kribbella voronezhensis TaxID=2512212 RepID=A0A4R7T9J2_9ACTN|nr:hypothetical protein [Kribbella voronezhensis]TDU88634.1 hypothetical protein EV138_2180 [Kribbella voronezhensis]